MRTAGFVYRLPSLRFPAVLVPVFTRRILKVPSTASDPTRKSPPIWWMAPREEREEDVVDGTLERGEG